MELNKKIVSYLIPISLILSPFAILEKFYSVGLILLLIYGCFSITFMKNAIKLPKYLMAFIICYVSIYSINVLRTGGSSLNILNFVIGSVLSLFYLSTLIGGFEFKKFYPVYKIITYIVSIVLIVQSFGLFLFDIPAIPINLLPVPEADYNFWDYFKGERPSGFFSEPQAFCSFVIPCFVFSLYRKEFLTSGLIFFAILLSTSTLGLAVSLIILIYFLTSGTKISIATKMGFIIGGVAIFFTLLHLGLLDTSIDKLKSTPLENNIRLVRGFYIYSNFNSIDKLFGISYDLQSYVLENVKESWVSLYVNANLKQLLGYTTSFSGLLIQFGILSFILYIFFLIDCYRNASDEIKMLVIVTFILCFVQTIIFNAWFIFYMSIILGSNYERGTSKFLVFK